MSQVVETDHGTFTVEPARWHDLERGHRILMSCVGTTGPDHVHRVDEVFANSTLALYMETVTVEELETMWAKGVVLDRTDPRRILLAYPYDHKVRRIVD